MSKFRKDLLHYVLNVVLVFVFAFATYKGYLHYLWETDISKLSFGIITVFFLTSWASMLERLYDKSTFKEIADWLPAAGLIGTVVGFIFLFGTLRTVQVNSAGDFKNIINPILIGTGTALQTTLLGIVGNLLLRVQWVLKKPVSVDWAATNLTLPNTLNNSNWAKQ